MRFVAGVSAIVVIAVGALAGVSQGSIGQPVLQGKANVVGSASTSLQASGTGPAFLVKNTGSGNGISVSTNDPGQDGLLVANGANTHGSGAAIEARGGNNSGLTAVTTNSSSRAVEGINATGKGIGVEGVASSPTGFGVYSVGNIGVSNGRKIECGNCVTGGDLDLLSVLDDIQSRIARDKTPPGFSGEFLSFGKWTITESCLRDPAGSGSITATVGLQSKLKPAFLSVNSGPAERFNGTASTLLLRVGPVAPGDSAGLGGAFTAEALTGLNHVEGQVMAVVDANTSDLPKGPLCVFGFSGHGE
jgi:hypothetical protein